MTTADSKMSVEDVENFDCLLNNIRKCPEFVYESPQIIHLFDLSNEKSWVIGVLLLTNMYNEDNYKKVINDIVEYYQTKNLTEKFKRILKNILEINKKDILEYYPNNQQKMKMERITELLATVKN
jgi:hypothetical protein